MELNEDIYYKKEKDRKKDCSGLWFIVTILAIILSFFVGVLIAEITSILPILGISGVIALIIVFSVLLIIAIISLIYCKKSNKKKYCC